MRYRCLFPLDSPLPPVFWYLSGGLLSQPDENDGFGLISDFGVLETV